MDLIRNSFEAGELAPGMNGRTAARQYPHGCRILENCVVPIGNGGAERRPGFEVLRETIVTPGPPEVPEVPATYNLTYVSEENSVWGIPLRNATVVGLDAGGGARNVGTGVVGLPFTGHPFAAGQKITISGTTYYNATYILQAGTTADELQILHSYNVEVFDGTEKVIREIPLTKPNLGAVARDADGAFYYGHNYDEEAKTCLTMILPDGTEETDFVTWPAELSGATVSQLVLSDDDSSLYVLTDGPDAAIKFNLQTGVADWIATISYAGYDISVDANDNAYVPTSDNCLKLAAPDGTSIELTEMGAPAFGSIVSLIVYPALVNDALGIVVVGGYQAVMTSEGADRIAAMYNLAVRTLDNSAGDTIRLGDTYAYGLMTYTYNVSKRSIAISGEYLYVLVATDGTTTTVYKLHWDGSSLAVVDSWAGPSYGRGLFFDLWGNLVVINQQAGGGQTTVFYYYDTEGTFLGSAGNFPTGLLHYWSSVQVLKGDVAFDGDLGSAAVPGPDVTELLPVEL